MLVRDLKDFFAREQLVQAKLLLALSGGADSMALFWALTLLRRQGVISGFAAAHVNHNWRPESYSEAQQLKEIVEKEGVAFHLHTLAAPEEQANLEERCRQERLAFFSSLAKKEGYTHLILGHHADDQAETVLKRLFEGANLEALGGMRQVALFEELTLLRPLLSTKKKQLIDWLKTHQYTYFEDQTNRDVRFLRAKMRHLMMPQLSLLFGKEVGSPLIKIAQRFEQISDYLDHSLMGDWVRRLSGSYGIALDLSRFKRGEEVAVSYLLRKMCRSCGFILSSSQIDQAAEAIIEKKAPCVFEKGGRLLIERGFAFSFFAKTPLEAYKEPSFSFCKGEYRLGALMIKIEEKQPQQSQASGWPALWQGCLTCDLPSGHWQFIARDQLDKPQRRRFEELQRREGVPSFLRRLVPAAVGANGEMADLITNKMAGLRASCDSVWRVEIRLAVEAKEQNGCGKAKEAAADQRQLSTS